MILQQIIIIHNITLSAEDAKVMTVFYILAFFSN